MTPDRSGQTQPQMTHRQIMEALSGLLLGLFVAMLSSTVVTNALPTIVSDLGGGQGAYTGIVTATLLGLTASTPIWGKLADLMDRKRLIQTALAVYAAGSVLAGLAPSVGVLIGARALQGIGAGGVVALTQIILAAIISPRDRGRYTGYIGAVFAVATISGPLVGGLIVDTSFLGWRWCFFLGVPVAVLAQVVLQRTLKLADTRREVTLDLLGASLIVAGVSLLLVWVSLAGTQFAWASVPTAIMLPGAVVLLALAVRAERRAVEPVIPPALFRERTVVLTTAASLLIGTALFGSTVFLSQYFQLARGYSPTEAGLLGMPLVLGLSVASLVVGRVITRTGRWKRWLVLGTLTLAVGLAMLAVLRSTTPYALVALAMVIVGAGLGATIQNLVLAVQNTVPVSELGSATATVTFFRSLGGALGVSALGALLGHRVTDAVASGLDRIGAPLGALAGGTIPDVTTLPGPVRAIVEDAYGRGTASVFLVAAPLALLAVGCVLAIRETPLRTAAPDAAPADPAPADPAPADPAPADPAPAATAPAASAPVAEPGRDLASGSPVAAAPDDRTGRHEAHAAGR